MPSIDGDDLIQNIERMTGMPYDVAKPFIDALYRSDVDDSIDAIRGYLIQAGVETQEGFDADMFAATNRMAEYFKPKHPDSYEGQKEMLRCIDEYYLGHLVHKYYDHLLGDEDD